MDSVYKQVAEIIFNGCDNDVDIFAELTNGGAGTERVLSLARKILGYDGVIYDNGDGTHQFVAFESDQFKNADNTAPTVNKDIRFKLSEKSGGKKYSYELSGGKLKKLADMTRMKVYTKAEAEGIISDILGSYMSFGDTYGVLSGKSKAEVTDILWRGLNTAEPGKRAGVVSDVSEYIIKHAAVESMYEDPANEAYVDTVALLKPYRHSIALDAIKGEIKQRYDKDKSPYLLWGKRKGTRGITADVIAMELEGLGFHIDANNEADIFFQIDDAYRSAVAGLKKEAKVMLDTVLNAEERKQLKQEVTRQVLAAFDEKGSPSALSKLIVEYTDKANVWKERYYEERKGHKLVNRILDKVQKLKDIKLGAFLNASQFQSDLFKGSIEKLAGIKYRGNINESGTREILAGLSKWYVKDNPMLQSGLFEEEISDMLGIIRDGEGKLTANELAALENVIDYFKHFIENYNKVWSNGRYVDALPIAKEYVSKLQANEPVKVGWLRKLFESYETTFADPSSLVRYMDKYEKGFYTDIFEELRKGAVGASVMEMEIREPLEAFYGEHKSFLKDMSKKTVEYRGAQIPLANAMLVYMSLNRDQAILGLAKSGFAFDDGEKRVYVAGFAPGEDMTLEELRVKAKKVRAELADRFTETEKEYISIVEKIFNEDCKEAKKKTDILRRGYTNVLEGYYVPIRRDGVARSIDTHPMYEELRGISNASFNRDTVKGAKNRLFIEALDTVLNRHIRAVSQYANLALVLDRYNVLYNLDISGNPNAPNNVKKASVNTWRGGDEYFSDLISDVQGISTSKKLGKRAMSRIRSGYARYQLGANPKVLVSQLSSFAAAGCILDVDCIVGNIGIKAGDVDKYCSLAKVRNSENTAALAQGLLDKTGKIGDILMKPIGTVDRFVVTRLFAACQLQIQKTKVSRSELRRTRSKPGSSLRASSSKHSKML